MSPSGPVRDLSSSLSFAQMASESHIFRVAVRDTHPDLLRAQTHLIRRTTAVYSSKGHKAELTCESPQLKFLSCRLTVKRHNPESLHASLLSAHGDLAFPYKAQEASLICPGVFRSAIDFQASRAPVSVGMDALCSAQREHLLDELQRTREYEAYLVSSLGFRPSYDRNLQDEGSLSHDGNLAPSQGECVVEGGEDGFVWVEKERSLGTDRPPTPTGTLTPAPPLHLAPRQPQVMIGMPSCLICHCAFNTGGDLEAHAVKHHHRTFPCQELGCRMSFTCRDVRGRHFRTHKDKHTCDICGTKIVRKDQFKRHMRMKHPGKALQPEGGVSKAPASANADLQTVMDAEASLRRNLSPDNLDFRTLGISNSYESTEEGARKARTTTVTDAGLYSCQMEPESA